MKFLACSRRKADLEATRTTTFHCDSKGNYEPLQCDMVSKQCWCADSMTGDLVSPVVPLRAIRLLSCCTFLHRLSSHNTANIWYLVSVEVYGSQYLRQCESKKFAQTAIREKLQKHGVTYITEDFLLCDNDGAYGSFTIENDKSVYFSLTFAFDLVFLLKLVPIARGVTTQKLAHGKQTFKTDTLTWDAVSEV